MTLVKKVLRISELVNSDGGTGFLKIRLLLEDVESEIAKGNPKALQFEAELNHVVKLLEVAVKMPLDSGT